MKLYTKEMFLIAAEKCEVSMIDAKHIMQYIDEYVTPIELPSEEEIDAFINKNFISHGEDNWQRKYFKAGAKWIKDKIQGGNK